MKRIAAILLWSGLFLVILFGVDQFFLRVPASAPVLDEVRTFYLDFRGRLLKLAGREPEATLESVIEGSAAPAAARPAGKGGAPRYLYVDGQGELQFADTLEEVPAAYRKEAQPIGR